MQFNTSSARYTLGFMIILSVICAVILSSLASALKEDQEIAKDLDRSKEMLIAAKILSHEGYFLLPDDKGEYKNASYLSNGILEAKPPTQYPTQQQLLDVYHHRLIPFLVNSKGKASTFEEQKIEMKTYLSEYKKTGYYKKTWRLMYKILPNGGAIEPMGYVIPVNGYGLWDAIFGYLALSVDGNTVIGISWYDQKETPGLGANIAEAEWQANFPGKKLFAQNNDGTTDFKRAQLGINVVRGKVSEVLAGNSKALNAVDGMAGATLTGNGVNSAYKDTLNGYRAFLETLTRKEGK